MQFRTLDTERRDKRSVRKKVCGQAVVHRHCNTMKMDKENITKTKTKTKSPALQHNGDGQGEYYRHRKVFQRRISLLVRLSSKYRHRDSSKWQKQKKNIHNIWRKHLGGELYSLSPSKELALNWTEPGIKVPAPTFSDVNFCQGLFYAHSDVWSTYWTWPATGSELYTIHNSALSELRWSHLQDIWNLHRVTHLEDSEVKDVIIMYFYYISKRWANLMYTWKVDPWKFVKPFVPSGPSFNFGWASTQASFLRPTWTFDNIDNTAQSWAVQQFWFEGGNFGSGGGQAQGAATSSSHQKSSHLQGSSRTCTLAKLVLR